MKHRLLLLPIFVLVVAGCQGGAKTTTTNGGGTPSPTSTGSSGTTGTQANNPNRSTAKRSEIPASLKHDAYAYFGFENESAVDYKITTTASDVVSTGGASILLNGITEDGALFTIERTGSLQEMVGNQDYEVKADGVYANKYANATLEPPRILQMPAQLTPGKTWPVKMTLTKNDNSVIVEDSVYKVEGIRKVKTEAGEYDALLITSTGTIEVNGGGKNKASTKSYYVKDRGLVMAEVSVTRTENGKPKTDSVTIQETK